MQKTNLKMLNVNDPDEVGLMYKIRKHPKVDFYLSGTPPQDYLIHITYLHNIVKKNKNFYIVYDDNIACGYCQSTHLDDSIELGWALHPDWWNKGIGGRSVDLLIKETQKMNSTNKKIFLIVKKNNPIAIKIYQKHGFKIVQEENEEFKMELNE
jgi:RimJ/RimL family protein N-acetyltransferase